MHRRTVFTVLLFGLLVWATPCVGQNAAAAPKSLADFDAIVAKAITDSHIPGLSIAVVQDGKVIYAKGFGFRDVENKLPVTTDTLFAIGSVSKSFTSLIFGTLNDEGKVEWDSPVRTYLPTFQIDDPIATDHATHAISFPTHRLPDMISPGTHPTPKKRLQLTEILEPTRVSVPEANIAI
jgi:CubicO group peptidase (beta-lactamase class C family)